MTDEIMEEMPKVVTFEGVRDVDKNRNAFRKMLETYVPQIEYSAPQHPRILSLGCEKCYEAFVLSGYFGGKPDGSDSEDVLLVGIDLNEKVIESVRIDYQTQDAKIHFPWTKKPANNYKFIHGDATQLRQLVDDEFDIVVARHPNVFEIPETWYTIFKESNGLMRPEGLFIATSFSDKEHKMLEDQVQKIGYKIALSTPNAYAIPSSHEKISFDRNVLLARK